MFVGHGLVAFAIATSVASRRGWDSDRALAVGVVAGLFATVPDIDMAYAVVGLVGSFEGVIAASDAFWAAAHEVHRAVTHSVVVGVIGAVGFACWRARSRRSLGALAVAVLAGLVAVVAVTTSPLAATLLGAFVLAGLGIVSVAEQYGFGARTVLAAALLGLVSHPFGDLLTGQPPALLYPIDAVVLSERVILHADPTLHLLGAFFVELATLWLALLVVVRVRGSRVFPHVRPRAVLGVGYGAAILAVPTPTVEVASPFVFSVLSVGLVAIPVRSRDRWTWVETISTALAAVTVAALAYTGAYLLV
ncbi:MAG: membrane-bound metal-dependent hydrolase YbcI (DUF457 family) [Haloarculaceae archaeon]|jgi:membrane-bound metal-dependent hydrolase YbcI (DUF457 family)